MTGQIFTRRHFLNTALLGGASALIYTLGLPSVALAGLQKDLRFHQSIKDPKNPTSLEKDHLIDIRLPVIAEDGANVPIVVSLNHPMEADHYIKTIQILNFNDPVVSKGVYHFTPAAGQAYIATQLRLDGGDAEVFVVAECSKHGKWVTSKTLKVSLGGC